MDSSSEGKRCCDVHEETDRQIGKASRRHSSGQLKVLEDYFKNNPSPDEHERLRLSQELKMEPRQVKFWFQNKRTQTRANKEKEEKYIIKAENEQLQMEKLAYKEATSHNIQAILYENSKLKEEVYKDKAEIERLRLENLRLKEEVMCATPHNIQAILYENTRLKEELQLRRHSDKLMASNIGGGSSGFTLFGTVIQKGGSSSSSFPAQQLAPRK